MKTLRRWFGLVMIVLLLAPVSRADTISLISNRENSIYEDFPTNSDGGGPTMFAGLTQNGYLRHALFSFDIAGNIPAGSTINSVQLRLVLNHAGDNDTDARQMSIY